MSKSPERPHQHTRLRLDSFDSGENQDCTIENPQYPLHLGDEVRVAGCVDQVDSQVMCDRERRDR